jgi:hypothetical protein
MCIRFLLTGVDHDVATLRPWIQRVLVPTDVISCVIDPEDLRGIESVVHNANSVAFGIGKYVFIAIVIAIEQAP